MKILIREEQLNTLIETHQDIPEISKLSNDIIDVVFPKLKHYYIDAINSAQRNGKVKVIAKTTGYYLKNLFNDDYTLSNFDRLIPFINDSNIRIAFTTQMGDNYGGSFHKNENIIIINLNDPELNNEIYRYANNYHFKLNDQRIINALLKFKSNLNNSLPHELQHGYDNFRSNGNFDNNPKTKLYTSKWNPIKQNFDNYKGDINNLYLKLPHEIWARLTGYLTQTDISKMSFKQLISDFKQNYDGYNIINDKTKKRLINVLFKYYSEHNNSK